jgi:hypothetical protein
MVLVYTGCMALVHFIGAFRIRSGMPFEMPFASLPHCGVILHVVGIGC